MFRKMTETFGYSVRQLAQKVGKDKGYVENRLRLSDAPAGLGGGSGMPQQIAEGFAAGMAQAMLLPACVLCIALIAALFLGRARADEAQPAH